MLYNKNNLLISNIVNKNHVNEILSGVYFKLDRTVATDSYILMEVINPEFMQTSNEYPIIENNKIIAPDMVAPYNVVKKTLKNLSEISQEIKSNLPILENAVFLDSENCVMFTTDLETKNQVDGKRIQGKYPNTSVIDVNKDLSKTVKLDVKKLKQIVDVISKFDIDENNTVELFIEDTRKPMLIEAEARTKQKIRAFIMPLNKLKQKYENQKQN